MKCPCSVTAMSRCVTATCAFGPFGRLLFLLSPLFFLKQYSAVRLFVVFGLWPNLSSLREERKGVGRSMQERSRFCHTLSLYPSLSCVSLSKLNLMNLFSFLVLLFEQESRVSVREEVVTVKPDSIYIPSMSVTTFIMMALLGYFK